MSPDQREAHEESKLKMRKAMADPALVDEMEQVCGIRITFWGLHIVRIAELRRHVQMSTCAFIEIPSSSDCQDGNAVL